MKYMLMMNVPAGVGDYSINSWTPEVVKEHMNHMHALNRDLKEAGEFVMGEGLTPPGQAKLVRVGNKGEPITDGPFPETKEFLAGFWIVDVESQERAYEIAARVSAAPGPDGQPLRMSVEVRPVLSITAPNT